MSEQPALSLIPHRGFDASKQKPGVNSDLVGVPSLG